MMKTSTDHEVREMYNKTADQYASSMDNEIALPLYANTLRTLSQSIADIDGALIDTSCGSGHMLSMYQTNFDPKRPLIGIDLSPRMVALTSDRLGSGADVRVGDMRNLEFAKTGSAAGAISFFAIHHLDPEEVRCALDEWWRVLTSGGKLLLAAWEGSGTIDYGTHSDLVAFRFTSDQISTWANAAGFSVSRCDVEAVDEMSMDAVYLEATKP